MLFIFASRVKSIRCFSHWKYILPRVICTLHTQTYEHMYVLRSSYISCTFSFSTSSSWNYQFFPSGTHNYMYSIESYKQSTHIFENSYSLELRRVLFFPRLSLSPVILKRSSRRAITAHFDILLVILRLVEKQRLIPRSGTNVSRL